MRTRADRGRQRHARTAPSHRRRGRLPSGERAAALPTTPRRRVAARDRAVRPTGRDHRRRAGRATLLVVDGAPQPRLPTISPAPRISERDAEPCHPERTRGLASARRRRSCTQRTPGTARAMCRTRPLAVAQEGDHLLGNLSAPLRRQQPGPGRRRPGRRSRRPSRRAAAASRRAIADRRPPALQPRRAWGLAVIVPTGGHLPMPSARRR